MTLHIAGPRNNGHRATFAARPKGYRSGVRKEPDLVDYIAWEQSIATEGVSPGEACRQAASVSVWCASSCLGAHQADLTRCIEICLDTHDVLQAAATVLTKVGLEGRAVIARSIAFSALVAVGECAVECQLHSKDHRHCELCATACIRAAIALRSIIESLDAVLSPTDTVR